ISTSRSFPMISTGLCFLAGMRRPFLDPDCHSRWTTQKGAAHLEHLLKAVPYRIHTILTDNGIQFAEQPRNRNTAWSRQMRFDMICEANDIEHRLTKPNHPWTNGQVERMNRTIKEATVKRFHYESHDQLRMHLADFMAAYNFARRLKTLSGLTPYEYIAKIWTSEPDRFIVDPIHQMPGLNT
ncbi:integrase core domain-containing protein, partial [Sphingomonas sp. T9W2]|uniref:integrase core domain-containing protein n=1 Tax=Sphingomonas sp. T9W2 TaxID=3143183 RepID=UPI0031F4DFD8